jgi:hypothetical protein
MMQKVKMLWMPVLLGALLMAMLVGVAGARPNARPEASPALVDYMFGANRCTQRFDGNDWFYTQGYIQCNTPNCAFVCPMKPPHEGLIRVQRLAMYAYDDLNVDGVCIWLTQVYPKTGSYWHRLGHLCTADSSADPQVCAYNPANFKVSVLQDVHVYVRFWGTTPKLYGFKLKYEPL